MGRLKVSFVIRTYNEAAFIGRLLDCVAAQEGLDCSPEIVVIDSGSTDDTVDIARQMGARLLHITREEFDYSLALNRGIEAASGDLIVIISAHSIPCDSRWLSSMLAHFHDPTVAGVFCRQVPWPDAYWWEARRLRKEFGPHSTTYGEHHRSDTIPFSNSASCIRRAVWHLHPFCLPTGEDGEWATWAVAHGHKIVYDATASVFHSHNESCRQTMRRVVQFERAADLRLGRSRTRPLTWKQAAGLVFRDLRDVFAGGGTALPRLAWQSLVRGYWFIRHFEGDARFQSPVRSEQ